MATETRSPAGDWILVVEDEPDLLEILCMVLEEHGIRAVGASDGREGLERLRATPLPALVILDLMMPGLDGWGFRAEQLRDPRLADIPVLVLSGDGRVERKAASLSANGYIHKPVGVEDLLRMVERHRRPAETAPTAQP